LGITALAILALMAAILALSDFLPPETFFTAEVALARAFLALTSLALMAAF
jgi:hypothetical protein